MVISIFSLTGVHQPLCKTETDLVCVWVVNLDFVVASHRQHLWKRKNAAWLAIKGILRPRRWTRLQKYFPQKAAVKAPGGRGRAPASAPLPWRSGGVDSGGRKHVWRRGNKVAAGNGRDYTRAQTDNAVWGGRGGLGLFLMDL